MISTCKLEARTFRLDVTPPIGDYVCGGLSDRSLGVETALELRGVLLEAGTERCALVVVDYCYLCGRSHRRLVEAVAKAADLPAERVSVHANHVHDAPLINEEAHAAFADSIPEIHNENYFVVVLEGVGRAIGMARRDQATPIDRVSFNSAPVYQFASSRRVLDADNRCAVRWSVLWRPEDMHLKEAPEGRIDPMLDQVNFYDAGGVARISLNFYASHPQVSSGRLLWSSDTIGVARELFESRNSGTFALNFDGCGGDVTGGKYTTLNRQRNRLVFGLRLYDAMQAALDSRTIEPVQCVGWIRHSFEMPLCRETHDARHFERIVRDDSLDLGRRYLAAAKLVKLHNEWTTYPFALSRLMLNDFSILFMPAELCIEYQLFAKRKARSRLTAAAYGDCYLNYIATDEAFEQGGYEVDPDWTEVRPGCEGQIKKAIEAILSHSQEQQ
jgi:hypothetical protein